MIVSAGGGKEFGQTAAECGDVDIHFGRIFTRMSAPALAKRPIFYRVVPGYEKKWPSYQIVAMATSPKYNK